MKAPSLKTILLGATLAIGTPLAVHQCQEKNSDRVASVLSHDGSVNMHDKEVFLKNTPGMTAEKDIFLSIKSKHMVIEGLMRNHEAFGSDDVTGDNALHEKLRDIYQRITLAKRAEEFSAIDHELAGIITELQKVTLSHKEKINKKIQDGLDHISKGDIERTQGYISECLKMTDNELSTPNRKIDYMLADTEEMMTLIKTFTAEKDHEKASVYLRDIIAHLEKISEGPNSPYSMVHLGEIAEQLHDRDSIGELIIRYGATAVILAALLAAAGLGVWHLDGHFHAQKRLTGKSATQRTLTSLGETKDKARIWWNEKKKTWEAKKQENRARKLEKGQEKMEQDKREKEIKEKQKIRNDQKKKFEREIQTVETLYTSLKKAKEERDKITNTANNAVKISRADANIDSIQRHIDLAFQEEERKLETLKKNVEKEITDTAAIVSPEDDEARTEEREKLVSKEGSLRQLFQDIETEITRKQGMDINLRKNIENRHQFESRLLEITLF